MSLQTAPRRAEPARHAVKRPPRGGRVLTALGLVCLLFGLGALGWTAYELFWNPLVDPKVAAEKIDGLREEWQSAPVESRPVPGDAVALLRIPGFGPDFEQPVLAGTDPLTLKKGLGWFEGAAAPGEIGNFSVAGHRGTKGPFAPMQKLKIGDQIIVETRTTIFTYELTNNPKDLTVMNTDTWVIQPVPGKPEIRPTEALITLTTCANLFTSPERMIAFGKLVNTQQK